MTLFSDSELTLNRIFKNYNKDKLPPSVKTRLGTVFAKVKDRVNGVLVAGHPTKKDLAQGFKTKGNKQYPVSKWNVLCDSLCTQEASKFDYRQ